MISDLAAMVADPQAMIAVFTAIAVFATIVTVTMPMLKSDELTSRSPARPLASLS